MKWAALTMAISVCMSTAVSCSSGSKGDSSTSSGKTKEVQTADQLVTNSYKSIDMDLPDNVRDIDTMLSLGDNIFISAYDNDNNNKFYITDEDFLDFKEIEIIPEDAEGYNSFRFASAVDGSLYCIITTVTHGDFPEPDWDDENFDYESFDFDAYQEAAEYSYTLVHYDTDGNLISSVLLDTIGDYIGDSDITYLNFLMCCSDGTLLIVMSGDEDEYITMDDSGNIKDSFTLSDYNWMNYVSSDSTGRILCDFYDDDGQTIRDLDIENHKFGDINISFDDFTTGYMFNTMIAGVGDYTLFLPISTGLYGMKEDGTVEEIVNWIDSDIASDSIGAIYPLENGDFIVMSGDGLVRLTARDTSELSDTSVITVGVMYADSNITYKITQFNKSQDEYRVKIKDYSEYDDYDSESGTYLSTSAGQLRNDIITGNAPDVICVDDYSVIDSFSSKGTFVDLYSFMENDSELTKDMFLPNILTALEKDGKLYSLAYSFGVDTFAAKTKFVPQDKQNWTIDDMIEICSNLPDDMAVFQSLSTKIDVFNNLWYSMSSQYIDYENATCSFDSPDFIKFLEFCNTFEDEDETYDFENMTDEEWTAYYYNIEGRCRNDEALLDYAYIDNVRSYAQIKQAIFNGEDITFVGTPSDDGQGAKIRFMSGEFAILSDSGCKEGAWEFIKSFFTDEYQETVISNEQNMSPLVEYFDKGAESAMEKPYYIDGNGEKVEYDYTYGFYNGDNIVIDPLTQEEVDFITDYIKSITVVSGSYNYDINSICSEEVQAYFNGEKTAEETAGIIQNRVSILISEQS
jgi:ABC-type glycerol-3-phosphate transport system substrate-binding protein